jgi:hypothetical protein
MRVTWFCFVSHIFAEEKVPLKTINVLVRLFLSSCRRFWILGNRNGLHESTDELSTSQKGLSGQKRKVDDDKLANTSKIGKHLKERHQTILCEQGQFLKSLEHW